MNLDERAGRAAASVRQQAEQLDTDAMLDRVRGTGGRPRWVVPAVAATAAAAAVILVVGLVLPQLQVDRVEIAPDPMVPGDPEPSPDETTTSDPAPAVALWQRVTSETFAGPGDDRMRAVAHDGGTTVAVGRSADGPGIWWRDPHRPADDPVAWEQVGADLCGDASCELHDVTTSAGRFVAVGMLDSLAKVWVSDDGRSWQRIDLDRPPTGGPAGETILTAVAGHEAGLVAIGHEQLPGTGSRPVVFTSADGGDWSEAPVSFDSEEAGAGTVDAAHVGDGRVVGLGYVGDGTVLWEEHEGTWTERHLAETDPTFSAISTFVTSIRNGDRGELLLTGSERGEQDEDGRVWRSVDGGATWDAMPGDMGGPGDQRVTALLEAGGSMIAVGWSRGAGTGDSRPAAWMFRDGRWEPADGGDAFADPGAIQAVVETDGHSAIAVGTAGGGGDPNEGPAPADAAVWTYTAPEGTASGTGAATGD